MISPTKLHQATPHTLEDLNRYLQERKATHMTVADEQSLTFSALETYESEYGAAGNVRRCANKAFQEYETPSFVCEFLNKELVPLGKVVVSSSKPTEKDAPLIFREIILHTT